MVPLFYMRYAPTIIALASIVFLLSFGSFAMATMTDHSGDCPIAIANGFNCLNAVTITGHLTAIQQLLQAVVQNVSMLTFAVIFLVLIWGILMPPMLIPISVFRTRTSAVSIARQSISAWQSRCAHSPTFA